MVLFMEDPVTGDIPHRGLVEEEDEQVAAEVAPQYTASPTIQWNDGCQVQDPAVIFLLGKAACLLADAFFPGLQPVGTITVPELVRVKSPLEEEYGAQHKPLHTCTMHTLAPGSSNTSSTPLLLVACPRELPQEQAGTWARAVLPALRPTRALAAATLPAMHYRGPGSPADEDLVFALLSSAADGAAGSSSMPPPLPQATLVGGLAAALLTDCELAGLPAALVVGVQQQQVPDAQFLHTMGRGVQGAMASLAGGGSTAGQHEEASRQSVLGVLRAAADAVYRSSASASIFA